MIVIDPSDAVPIWKQIEDGVHHLIGSGGLRPSQVIPSVRDLARELRVNPATVAKAYQKLRAAGWLEVRRGEGTFVAERLPEADPEETRRALGEAAASFVRSAATLGAETEEVRSAFEEALRDWPGK